MAKKKGLCDFEWKKETKKLRKYSPTYQERIRLFKKLTKNIKGKVLDDGCGGDDKVLFLPKTADYTGIDYSNVAVNHIKSLGFKAKKMDATKLKFKDNTFDYVLSFSVIEHIKDDSKYLKEAYRVLKKGGKLLFGVVIGKKYWSPIDEKFEHYRRYEADELLNMMEKTGFKIKNKFYTNVIFNYFYRLYTIKKARKLKNQVIPKENSFSIFLLKLFYPLTIFDRLFYKIGSWGMEIYVVAEK